MSTDTDVSALPVSDTIEAADVAGVQAAIREAGAAGTAVYPVGGGTSLHYGMPAQDTGWALDLSRLNQIVDYPARDLTITVEAGTPWRIIEETLAAENQELPFDPPHGDRATIGGIVACGWSGPRRLGCGSVRDFVIGVEAVDGHGRLFHGGGRVVKNVAGYDFCKLLTGSLGSLGALTRLTLRLRPRPESSLLFAVAVTDLEAAARLARRILDAPIETTTVGITVGEYWKDSPLQSSQIHVVAGVEGLCEEIDHSASVLEELAGVGGTASLFRESGAWAAMRQAVAAFPDLRTVPLVVRAKTVASGAVPWARAVLQQASAAQLFVDVGAGVVDVAFEQYPPDGLSALLVRHLQPCASKYFGHVRTLWNESGAEMTHQTVWGELGSPIDVMWQVKQAFDPHHILNRGRFVW